MFNEKLLMKIIRCANFIPQYRFNENNSIYYSFYSCFYFNNQLINLALDVREFNINKGYIIISILNLTKDQINNIKNTFEFIKNSIEYQDSYKLDSYYLEKSFIFDDENQVNNLYIFLETLKNNNNLFPYEFE
jgi:hypothetical protein